MSRCSGLWVCAGVGEFVDKEESAAPGIGGEAPGGSEESESERESFIDRGLGKDIASLLERRCRV